jgi:hypothetical protein
MRPCDWTNESFGVSRVVPARLLRSDPTRSCRAQANKNVLYALREKKEPFVWQHFLATANPVREP